MIQSEKPPALLACGNAEGKCIRTLIYLASGLAMSGALVATSGTCVLAQIEPDNTLGNESSVVKPNVNVNGRSVEQIEGGARRGGNLFHSFREFNVNEGQGVYFSNPAGVENILGRVTGGNPSEILGRLGVVNGDANLFLMNPNGIIFGANASLDVNGSFVATTANEIRLGETGRFSATEPQTSNLLTVNPSALFFNAVPAQPIVNQSQASSPNSETNSVGTPVGLQVQNGETLALVGGDVLLQRGNLTAAEGRIELGSVADVGEVSISQSGNSWRLGYEGVNDFGDISVKGAIVDVSGAGGGSLQIQGRQLDVSQGAGILAYTLGSKKGREILVTTTQGVTLSDMSVITTDVVEEGTGAGGSLTINTGNLIVRDGAQVSAGTRGEGAGGSLTINATGSVQTIGTSANGRVASGLLAGTRNSGNAGNLRIETRNLIVRDGAQVAAGTFGEG
jgi:filamentous hemagglutinin family protein